MGVSVHFCAIPPSSTLFGRLQSEKAFATLISRFFNYGSGIFSFFDEPSRFTTMLADDDLRERIVEDVISRAPPEHREGARRQLELARLRELGLILHQGHEDTLQEVVDRCRDVLGPEPEARRWIDEFRLELERTRSAHPGVEGRECWLEKTYHVIEQRLQDRLLVTRGRNTWKFVSTLMFGDQKLGQDLSIQAEDRLGLVSPALVREGAQALRPLDAEALFADDGDRCTEDFLRWRRLYQEAAAEGEALLVG